MRWAIQEKVPVTTYRFEERPRCLAVNETHGDGSTTWRIADMADLKNAVAGLSRPELAELVNFIWVELL